MRSSAITNRLKVKKMEETLDIIKKRLHENFKKQIDALILALDASSSIASTRSMSLANDIRYTSRFWKTRADQFIERISNIENLGAGDVIRMLELLPPDRAMIRYDLERLTITYRDICMSGKEEVVDLFLHAESACDRGDFDIGMNILEQIVQIDRRFFPAWLILGYGNLTHRNNPAEASKCFEQAQNFIHHEYADHYRSMLVELAAKAQEKTENPSTAIKTLKRLRLIEKEKPFTEYLIARQYARNGQKREAILHLQSVFDSNPEFIALAYIEQEFKIIQSDVLSLFDELNTDWSDNFEKLFDKVDKIIEMIKIYGLDERNREILGKLGSIQSKRKAIIAEGCYSRYREFFIRKIHEFIPSFPDIVVEELETVAEERREEINALNQFIFSKFKDTRGPTSFVALGIWIVVSIIIYLVIVSGDSSPLVGLMAIIAMIPFGYFAYSAYEKFHENRTTIKKIGNEPVNMVRGHQREINWTKANIQSQIPHDGWA